MLITKKLFDKAYGARSSLVHDGKSDENIEELSRSVSSMIREIFSSCLNLEQLPSRSYLSVLCISLYATLFQVINDVRMCADSHTRTSPLERKSSRTSSFA